MPELFVKERVGKNPDPVTEIFVPEAFPKVVVETVKGTENVAVDVVTANLSELLLSLTRNAPVDDVAMRIIKFGSVAVSARSILKSLEFAAVIVFPKSYAC